MPIFEYQCNACEIRFEVLQRTNDTNKSLKCPTCGKQDTKNVSQHSQRWVPRRKPPKITRLEQFQVEAVCPHETKT